MLERAVTPSGDPVLAATAGTAERILDAALDRFESVGITRTTVEDITRRARLSRGTVYRYFPGKDDIVEAVILRELGRFLTALEAEMATFPAMTDKLAEGFVFSSAYLGDHRLLTRLMELEPGSLLPYLTTEAGSLVDTAAAFLAVQLGRDAHEARSGAELQVVAEVAVRIVLSFLLTPSRSIEVTGSDAARDFARRHLVPLLLEHTAVTEDGGSDGPPAPVTSGGELPW